MKIIIKWPFWYKDWWGFTFAPFIFLKDPNNKAHLTHELTHLKQQYKHFIIWFWVRYLYQLFTKGYENIDYEIEAYNASRKA